MSSEDLTLRLFCRFDLFLGCPEAFAVFDMQTHLLMDVRNNLRGLLKVSLRFKLEEMGSTQHRYLWLSWLCILPRHWLSQIAPLKISKVLKSMTGYLRETGNLEWGNTWKKRLVVFHQQVQPRIYVLYDYARPASHQVCPVHNLRTRLYTSVNVIATKFAVEAYGGNGKV